jgi:hypothetical protein
VSAIEREILSVVSFLCEDNLGRGHLNALRQSWINLVESIGKESSLVGKHIADCVYGDELFRAIGYDNPDVLLLRWLRSRKWNVSATVSQITETLKWRRDWGVEQLMADGERGISQEEMATGKTYFMGHDKLGRPVCCIHPKEHIKGQFPQEDSERLTVFCVETYRKLLQTPIESVTVIFDMAGCDMKNMDFHQVKFLLHLLDNYYPDSLGLILILNFPWVLDKCWTVIKAWLNVSVQKKVQFIHSEDELSEFIDPAVLPQRLRGTQPDFRYLPPTDEDQAMFEAFRADHKGKAAHRDAVREYLAATLQWAQGDESRTSFIQRKKARKQLRLAFEQLSPYISTRTHYHRMGLINEPVFQSAYDRLRPPDETSVTFF